MPLCEIRPAVSGFQQKILSNLPKGTPRPPSKVEVAELLAEPEVFQYLILQSFSVVTE